MRLQKITGRTGLKPSLGAVQSGYISSYAAFHTTLQLWDLFFNEADCTCLKHTRTMEDRRWLDPYNRNKCYQALLLSAGTKAI